MLLNDAGAVIWQKNLPDDLPLQYTATDIAKFSRWYLKEYPTYVQEHTAGLLVVGGTPDSLVKWNYTMDTQYASFVLAGIVFVVTANIFLVLLLFWRNTHKIEKAITPVLQGIESISAGQKISLSEKGGACGNQPQTKYCRNTSSKKRAGSCRMDQRYFSRHTHTAFHGTRICGRNRRKPRGAR